MRLISKFPTMLISSRLARFYEFPVCQTELKYSNSTLHNSGVNSSCLSQWFEWTFTVKGCHYPTAEHWMMAEKARLFEDDDYHLQLILDCETPRNAKAHGRKVSGFDQNVWSENRIRIVTEGDLAKLGQHVRNFSKTSHWIYRFNTTSYQWFPAITWNRIAAKAIWE